MEVLGLTQIPHFLVCVSRSSLGAGRGPKLTYRTALCCRALKRGYCACPGLEYSFGRMVTTVTASDVGALPSAEDTKTPGLSWLVRAYSAKLKQSWSSEVQFCGLCGSLQPLQVRSRAGHSGGWGVHDHLPVRLPRRLQPRLQLRGVDQLRDAAVD